MSGKHAFFAPSSAHRVVHCPASLLRTKDLPDSVSFAAVEGTIAHWIHEYCLKMGVKAERFEGMRPRAFMDASDLDLAEWALVKDTRGLQDDDFRVDAEMVSAVQDSVDWCLEIDGDHFIEQRVNISEYTPIPDQSGTCDHAVIDRDGVLWITDLKFGTGVQVFAKDNHQLALYALGFIEEHDWVYNFDRVVIRVSQPRLKHRDVWETTAKELREFGYFMKARFALALKPDAPFGPEEHACKFCKLKPTCPALYEVARAAAQGWFDDLTQPSPQPGTDWPLGPPDAERITPEHLALVLANADLLVGYLEAVKRHAMRRLMHSEPVPGWKIVEGRSNRRIKDVAGYETHLFDNDIDPHKPRELITITEAEKKLKGSAKKALSQFTEKPPGKPTLAPESDPRLPYSLTADVMFGDETTTEDEL